MKINNIKNKTDKFGQILLKFSCFSLSVFIFCVFGSMLTGPGNWLFIIENFPFLFLLLYAALKLLDSAGILVLSFLYKKCISCLWIFFIILAIFYAFLSFYQYYYELDVYKNKWRALISILYVIFSVIVAIYSFKLKNAAKPAHDVFNSGSDQLDKK
jgi:hypothetical protein